MVRTITGLLLLLCIAGCTEDRPLTGTLRVCFPQSDLPRADRATGTGFDMDVARLVARELSREFIPVWLPRPDRTEIEVSDINYSLLAAGACDMQLSVPGERAIDGLDAVTLSAPYYGAAFELIPENANPDLANRDRGKMAVRSNTVAHIVVDRLGLPWTMKRDTDELIAAVTSSEVEAALIWGPDLALSRTKHHTSFAAPSVLKWNQHMALRKADAQLLADLDTLLSDEETGREIMDLLARYHIPVHAPFAETFRSSDLEEFN